MSEKGNKLKGEISGKGNVRKEISKKGKLVKSKKVLKIRSRKEKK